MVTDRSGVKVIHGANDGEFDVAGYSLTRLRSSLVTAFNIPEDAIALVNGQRVTLDYIAQSRDVIEFIRERGEKGGRRKIAAPPDDDGDDESDTHPDLSAMSLDELAAYADSRLAASHAAGQRAILQAHKSAVALFWAGAALYEARAKCKNEGRGRWTGYKAEHGFAHSTANDAIRLFENAKTPDALAGLGVTEAKQKFVYPEPKSPTTKPNDGTTKQTTASKRTQPAFPTAKDKQPGATEAPTKDEPEEAEHDEVEADVPELDPAHAIAEEFEDIAQRLNEIAQDDLGKVELTQEATNRLGIALRAVAQGLANIHRRINHDHPNS